MAGSKKKEEPKTEGEETPAKGGKKKIIIIAVAALVLLGGGWFMFLKPSSAAAEAEPEPGLVVRIDPININLAEGRYLKLGLALQATIEVKEELDGAKALDLAISQLSNKSFEELSSSEDREKAKETLLKAVEKAYHEEVMDLYFTEFVMQ